MSSNMTALDTWLAQATRQLSADSAAQVRTEIEQPLPAPLTPVVVPAPTPAPVVPPTPKPDRTPPRTKLLGHQAKTFLAAHGKRAAVAIRFAASERSHFECKLDGRPFQSCRSPFHARLAAGRHTFRVYAIDAAFATASGRLEHSGARPAGQEFDVSLPGTPLLPGPLLPQLHLTGALLSQLRLTSCAT